MKRDLGMDQALSLSCLALLWMVSQAKGDLGCPHNDTCIYFTDGSKVRGVGTDVQFGQVHPDTYTVIDSAPGSYALDIDIESKTIFWSEQNPNWKIRSIDLKTGVTTDIVTDDIGEVEGIAVDSIHKNVFFTDLTYEKIEVVSYDGTNRRTLLDKNSETSFTRTRILRNPKAIAVHPTKGYIFWVDNYYMIWWGFVIPYQKICRSSLAGTNYKDLNVYSSFTNRKYFPMSLTLDYQQDKLYAFDSLSGQIKSMDLEGRNQIVHHTSGHFPMPTEIIKIDDILYWSDRYSRTVERVRVLEKGDWQRLVSFGELSPDKIHGITGYTNHTRISGSTPCTKNNGGCSNLCLVTGKTARVCACPNEYNMLNSTTCSKVKNNVTKPTPPDVEVRLVGGKWDSEGRVEVKYRGRWGTICDNNFDMTEANVVCRMLNYTRALSVDTRVPSGSGFIFLDELKCRGDEKSISYCNHPGWGTHDCYHSEDVGVKCDNGTKADQIYPYNNATDLKVRLRRGEHPWEGVVEVFNKGEWGSICTNSRWTLKEADVICRMAGYTGAWDAQTLSYFGFATVSKIWTSDVVCHGNETSIGQCRSAGWGVKPTCTHYDDVSVTCKYTNDSGDIRIRDGYSEYEGRVEINGNQGFGWFCSYGWNITSAHVACKQLGFSKGALSAITTSVFGDGYHKSLNLGISCKGDEKRLQDCPSKPGRSYFCNPASVVCKSDEVKPVPPSLTSLVIVSDQARNLYKVVDPNSKHTSYDLFPEEISSPTLMDFDQFTRELYATDSNKIYKVDVFSSKVTVISEQVGTITDLEIDYVCGKIYWVMYFDDKMMVSNLDGSHETQLLHASYIMTMTLDIKNGVMYYIADRHSKIYRAHMDGSNSSLVYTLDQYAEPYSLTIDDKNNELYWVDDNDNRLKYLDLDSMEKGVQKVALNNVNKPYEITIFDDYLYWTAKNPGSTAGLFRMALSGDGRHRPELVLSDFILPNGIAAVSNRAVDKNIACTSCECEMCLRSNTSLGHTCNCSNIRVYDEQKKQCYTPNFLVFPDYTSETVVMMAEDESLRKGNTKHVISIKRSYLPDAIECDPVNQQIYYADIHQSIIARISYNGSSETVILHNGQVKYPRALAIDHVGRNLYYTDKGYDTIHVSKLDGTQIKTLINTRPARPTSIAIDYNSGYLYWGSVQVVGDRFHVGVHRSTMDGRDTVALRVWDAPYSYGPSQMTIYKNKLYWVGWHDDKIEYIYLNTSLDTAIPTQISGYEPYLYQPNGIHVTEKSLYWTDEFKGKLYEGSHDGKNKAKALLDGYFGIGALKYCKGKAEPKKDHPCGKTKSCTHLCLATPTVPYCACPDKKPSDGSCKSGFYSPTTAPPPTTAQPSTKPPTTTQTIFTEPPSEFQGTCKPNPCKNDGVCTEIEDKYKCKCPEFYGPPESCSLNLEDGVTEMVFEGKIKPGEMIAVLENVLREPRKRPKRESQPISDLKVYSLSDPEYKDGKTTLQVAAVRQNPDGSLDPKGVIPANNLENQIEEKKADISNVYEKNFKKKITVLAVKATPPQSQAKSAKSTGGMSGGATAGIVIAVIVVVALVVIVLVYLVLFRRRGKDYPVQFRNQESIRRPQGDMGTFSNPGFDVEPGSFESPIKDAGSVAMTPTNDMIPMENPLYGKTSDAQGINYTEKPRAENPYEQLDPAFKNPPAEKARPENQYDNIAPAQVKDVAQGGGDPQYENPVDVLPAVKKEWEEKFDEVSQSGDIPPLEKDESRA